MYRDYITSELTIKNSAYLNIYLNSRRIVNNKIDYLRHSNRQTLQPNFTFQTNYLRFKFLLFKRRMNFAKHRNESHLPKKKKKYFSKLWTIDKSRRNSNNESVKQSKPTMVGKHARVDADRDSGNHFFFLSSPPPSSSLSRSAPVFTLQALVNNQLVLFVNYNLAVYTGTELKFYDPTMLIGLPD